MTSDEKDRMMPSDSSRGGLEPWSGDGFPPPAAAGAERGEEASRPGIGDHERELVRRVSLLVRTLSTETQVYADLVCRLLDIHRTDLSALGHLERARVEGEPMTQADLGRALRMSGAAITALADRLERTGHVERRRSEHDRRKILLGTTEHARATGRESFGPLARATREALERYTDEELELVGRVLTDLVAASRAASRRAWECSQAGERTADPPAGSGPERPSRPWPRAAGT